MFYDLWCVSGVYLRGHALHRTRWIVKCGRLRILSCIYKTILDFELPATPSGIKGTVFFQFKQWVQDICHEDEGEKATWQNFGTASAFYICVLFCIYVHPRLNKQVAKRRARGRAWKKPGLKNPFPWVSLLWIYLRWKPWSALNEVPLWKWYYMQRPFVKCTYEPWGTYINTYFNTYFNTYINTYFNTYFNTYLNTYTNTYINTYINTYYTYTSMNTYILYFIHLSMY
jgi:hypothetical protein